MSNGSLSFVALERKTFSCCFHNHTHVSLCHIFLLDSIAGSSWNVSTKGPIDKRKIKLASGFFFFKSTQSHTYTAACDCGHQLEAKEAKKIKTKPEKTTVSNLKSPLFPSSFSGPLKWADTARTQHLAAGESWSIRHIQQQQHPRQTTRHIHHHTQQERKKRVFKKPDFKKTQSENRTSPRLFVLCVSLVSQSDQPSSFSLIKSPTLLKLGWENCCYCRGQSKQKLNT